jgi:hypothetical protein
VALCCRDRRADAAKGHRTIPFDPVEGSRRSGKVSPVHFFWGSFDLAVTRFSGRAAPPPGGATPNVAGWVMAEAYSHEVCSCGFWPGNGGYGRAAFYVYADPEPAGYGDASSTTGGALYAKGLGQFILPCDAVREAADPDALLLGFLLMPLFQAIKHRPRRSVPGAAVSGRSKSARRLGRCQMGRTSSAV